MNTYLQQLHIQAKLKRWPEPPVTFYGSNELAPQRLAAYKEPSGLFEIEVLLSKSDKKTRYQHAIMIFHPRYFCLIDVVTGQSIENQGSPQWNYDKISRLILEEHQHLGIRWEGDSPKGYQLKIMTSYLQHLTHILWVRSEQKGVSFEPFTRKFEYIDPRLLAVSPGEERPRPGCSDLLGDSDYPNDMLTEDVVLRPVMEVAKQIHRKIEAAQRLDPSRADMPLDHQLDKY